MRWNGVLGIMWDMRQIAQDVRKCIQIFKYAGESSKTTYTRAIDHLSNYRTAVRAGLPPLTTGEIFQPLIHVCTQGTSMEDWLDTILGCWTLNSSWQATRKVPPETGGRGTENENKIIRGINSQNEWFTPKLVDLTFIQQ